MRSCSASLSRSQACRSRILNRPSRNEPNLVGQLWLERGLLNHRQSNDCAVLDCGMNSQALSEDAPSSSRRKSRTQPENYSVNTMGLLLHSRLEMCRTRTVERSTHQIQALIDQMPTVDLTPTERLRLLHALPLPNK
jgi:hypothetical protein